MCQTLVLWSVFQSGGNSSFWAPGVWSCHIFHIQLRPVDVKNCLEPGLPLPWRLLSENRGATEWTDVSSGILSGQGVEGRLGIRLIGGGGGFVPFKWSPDLSRQLLRFPQPEEAWSHSLYESPSSQRKWHQRPPKLDSSFCDIGCRKQMSAPPC